MTRKYPATHTMGLYYIYQVPACPSLCSNYRAIEFWSFFMQICLFFFVFLFYKSKTSSKNTKMNPNLTFFLILKWEFCLLISQPAAAFAVLHFKMIGGSLSLSDNGSAQACNFHSNLFLSLMATTAQLGLSLLAHVILLTWPS